MFEGGKEGGLGMSGFGDGGEGGGVVVMVVVGFV